jgi:hypothetical protein
MKPHLLHLGMVSNHILLLPDLKVIHPLQELLNIQHLEHLVNIQHLVQVGILKHLYVKEIRRQQVKNIPDGIQLLLLVLQVMEGRRVMGHHEDRIF